MSAFSNLRRSLGALLTLSILSLAAMAFLGLNAQTRPPVAGIYGDAAASIWILFSTSTLLIAFIGWGVYKSALRPLQNAVHAMTTDAMSGRAFTGRTKVVSHGEIGDLLASVDFFVDRLYPIVVQMRDASNWLTNLAALLSAAAEQLTGIAQNQASSAEETAAAAEQITAVLESAGRSAGDQAMKAEDMLTRIRGLGNVIRGVTETMEAMGAVVERSTVSASQGNVAVQRATSAMNHIAENAAQISQIADMINEILDRTNLLALNASIEAARAGDSGRAFAVVAKEIAILADNTAAKVKDIDQFIVQSAHAVASGREEVSQAASIFGTIMSQVQETHSLIEQGLEATRTMKDQSAMVEERAQGVKDAAQTLSRSVQEQKAAMTEVESMTMSVAGDSSALSEASQKLAKTAEDLNVHSQFCAGMTKKFRVQDEDLIRWNRFYSLDIPEIDGHHQRLVALINRLYVGMIKGQSSEMLQSILAELVDFTVYHFSYEESLLKRFGYPEDAKHKKQHGAFVEKIRHFQEAHREGAATLGVEMMDFLGQWLMDHIMVSDKAYVPYVKGKRLPAPEENAA